MGHHGTIHSDAGRRCTLHTAAVAAGVAKDNERSGHFNSSRWASDAFRVRPGFLPVGCVTGSGGQSAAVDSGGTGFPGRPASRMMRGQRGSQHNNSDIQCPSECKANAGDANATMQATCQRRPARHSGLKKLKDAMTDSQGHGTLPSSFFGAGTD